MANDRHSAIYNARIPQMPSSRSRFGRAACPLFIILLLATYSAAAGNWASADEQLAAKIASVIGPGTAFIDFANRSSLTRAQTDEVRRGLLTELANHGVRFANAEQAAASVKVTFSMPFCPAYSAAAPPSRHSHSLATRVTIPGRSERINLP